MKSEVYNELAKINGLFAYKASYANKSNLVTYNKSKVDIKTIKATINKIAYIVKSYEVVNLK